MGLLILPISQDFVWSNIWISIGVIGLIRIILSICNKFWQMVSAVIWKRSTKKLLSQVKREQSEDDCCICHERLQEFVRLKCSHCYHMNCLMKWLQNNTTCPICRQELGNGYTKIIMKFPSEVDLFEPRGFFQILIR